MQAKLRHGAMRAWIVSCLANILDIIQNVMSLAMISAIVRTHCMTTDNPQGGLIFSGTLEISQFTHLTQLHLAISTTLCHVNTPPMKLELEHKTKCRMIMFCNEGQS